MRSRPGDRRKLNLISAVSPDGMRGLWFLKQLLEEVEGRPRVIWDNGRIHRSGEGKSSFGGTGNGGRRGGSGRLRRSWTPTKKGFSRLCRG